MKIKMGNLILTDRHSEHLANRLRDYYMEFSLEGSVLQVRHIVEIETDEDILMTLVNKVLSTSEVEGETEVAHYLSHIGSKLSKVNSQFNFQPIVNPSADPHILTQEKFYLYILPLTKIDEVNAQIEHWRAIHSSVFSKALDVVATS